MRNTFADTFYELAKKDSRLAVVVADISPAGSIAKFRQDFPSRFINTGVAEQIMIGMCAGMALRGMRPFAYTIATFALYRPFEFIRDDLAYHALPVTVVGIGGGVTYSTLGGTHHAMEDIAVATSIPGMTVIAPADPLEVKTATTWCANENKDGPVYLRLAKAGEPILSANAIEPFTVGLIRYLQRGNQVCVISYGSMLAKGASLVKEFEAQNLSVSLVSCHTLKPLDVTGIVKLLHSHNKVVVIEEHVPQGGLGAKIKEIAWDCKATCELLTYSLQDKFIHVYGSHEDLLCAHGLKIDGMPV